MFTQKQDNIDNQTRFTHLFLIPDLLHWDSERRSTAQHAQEVAKQAGVEIANSNLCS